MPFLSHLSELREGRVPQRPRCLRRRVPDLLGLADDIFAWLREPLDRHLEPAQPARRIELLVKLHALPPAADGARRPLIFTGITQPFWVNMSVAVWAGIFVASPFIFYQLLAVHRPGLYKARAQR